jgi:glycosyltransferase involved in cell wall biosynthesis
MSQTGLPPERFFYLPPFVDANRFYPRPASEELLDRWKLRGKKIILTVARLARHKGYETLLRAMPLILKQEPEARYVLVGGGEDEERLRLMISRMGLEDAVIMPGRVVDDELAEYYNLCDVFAMPSSGEGFGIVFLEALACGKPVIAGSAGGAAEAVLGGDVGLMVEPHQVEEISEAVLRCLRGDLPSRLKDPEAVRDRMLAMYGKEAFSARVRDLVAKFEDIKNTNGLSR